MIVPKHDGIEESLKWDETEDSHDAIEKMLHRLEKWRNYAMCRNPCRNRKEKFNLMIMEEMYCTIDY